MTEESTCAHHWNIERAQGGVPSEGTCQKCKAVRLFTNSLRQKVQLVGGGNDARQVNRVQKENLERTQRAIEQIGHSA